MEDELSEIPVELQIARGLDQIQSHTSKIAALQRNISSSLNTSSATGTTAWDEEARVAQSRAQAESRVVWKSETMNGAEH